MSLPAANQQEVEVVRHHREVHVSEGQSDLDGLLDNLLGIEADHGVVYVRTGAECLGHE